MSQYTISIIIPTFNSGKTVQRAIESILIQEFGDFELLVMDGMSSDDTEEIVKIFANKDQRVKWFSERDSGIYDAMNKGIEKAKGEWIYFLGSDDYLLNKNVLEEVFNKRSLGEFDFVYGNVVSPDYGSKYDGEFDRHKILSQNICHQAIFIKRTLYKRFGLFNTKYSLQADYDFNLRCILDKKVKKKYIDVLISWYAPGGSSIRKPDTAFEKDKTGLILRYGWNTLDRKQLYQLGIKKIKDILS